MPCWRRAGAGPARARAVAWAWGVHGRGEGDGDVGMAARAGADRPGASTDRHALVAGARGSHHAPAGHPAVRATNRGVVLWKTGFGRVLGMYNLYMRCLKNIAAF